MVRVLEKTMSLPSVCRMEDEPINCWYSTTTTTSFCPMNKDSTRRYLTSNKMNFNKLKSQCGKSVYPDMDTDSKSSEILSNTFQEPKDELNELLRVEYHIQIPSISLPYMSHLLNQPENNISVESDPKKFFQMKLTRRDCVMRYRTNFSAMPKGNDEWIQKKTVIHRHFTFVHFRRKSGERNSKSSWLSKRRRVTVWSRTATRRILPCLVGSNASVINTS